MQAAADGGMNPDLYDVHASVEGNGWHRAGVVVGHLHGSVPLAAVTVQQHPQAGFGQLIQGWDLLHVHCQLEGDVAQQGGGDVAGRPHSRPDPVQSPHQWRQEQQERQSSLHSSHASLAHEAAAKSKQQAALMLGMPCHGAQTNHGA